MSAAAIAAWVLLAALGVVVLSYDYRLRRRDRQIAALKKNNEDLRVRMRLVTDLFDVHSMRGHEFSSTSAVPPVAEVSPVRPGSLGGVAIPPVAPPSAGIVLKGLGL